MASVSSPWRAEASSSELSWSWKRSQFAYHRGPSTRTTKVVCRETWRRPGSAGEDVHWPSDARRSSTLTFGVVTEYNTSSSDMATARTTPAKAPQPSVPANAATQTAKSCFSPMSRRAQSVRAKSNSSKCKAALQMMALRMHRGANATASAATDTTAATTAATTTFAPNKDFTPSDSARPLRESPTCTGTPPTSELATFAAPSAQSSRLATTW
mmetsp:Transcript_17987/g.58645  ORF Transcript_17987/g.58645 Transcript_17987/m.58645 type:complete len:213 (-) Transcript_17987:352-990(-)